MDRFRINMNEKYILKSSDTLVLCTADIRISYATGLRKCQHKMAGPGHGVTRNISGRELESILSSYRAAAVPTSGDVCALRLCSSEIKGTL